MTEDLKIFETEEFKQVLFNYQSALKVLETEIKILNDEFTGIYKHNPVEHIKFRIKNPDSIIKKLHKKNYDITIENIISHVNDIAGIRIVCSFLPDIYQIVDIIKKSKSIKIIEEKDYIKNPKSSGYESYHLIVMVPIFLSSGNKYVKAEIQIRTVAMDFWASLEHKIQYKFPGLIPEKVEEELLNNAKAIHNIDEQMSRLNDIVKNYEKTTS